MPPLHGPETTEFTNEFTRETGELLRRRLLAFVFVWVPTNLVLLSVLVGVIVAATDGLTMSSAGWLGGVVGVLVWLCFYAGLVAVLRKRRLTSQQLVYASLSIIVVEGFFLVLLRQSPAMEATLPTLVVMHVVACCVFPWTALQALLPWIPVLLISLAASLGLERSSIEQATIGTAVSALAAGPGALICLIKNSRRSERFAFRFMQRRYGMLRQELAYARQLHESLFPASIDDGPVRFEYHYEPMRQIGGDFLFAQRGVAADGSEAITVVILDVTGHGIPAALTVNRLYGEIELRFAEQVGLSPGEILEQLNRYVSLTLAKHSIFVTAVCFRVEPEAGLVRYASAGHPPAFLRGVDGTVSELGSTTFLLGALKEGFVSNERTARFEPGDSLVAYTDGATEATTPSGKMLRVAGLRDLLVSSKPPAGDIAHRLAAAVVGHREGLPPADDTLIVEIFSPIDAGGGGGVSGGAAAGRAAAGVSL